VGELEALQRELSERRRELAERRRELAELRKEHTKASSDREQYRALYMQMLERCRLLERGIVAGQKAERFSGDDELQLSMQLLGMLLNEEENQGPSAEDEADFIDGFEDDDEDDDDDDKAAGAGDPTPDPPKRRRGRRRLPKALPRIEIELLPPEVEEEGKAAFRRIGEAVSEVVERRPASLVVVRFVRGKYARKDDPETDSIEAQLADETPESPAVVIAPPPERPIERGLAGPGLLASTIVQRWQDHLPLNRQESIYAREGLPLARQTICDWHLKLADLVEPLVDAMMADAFTSPYLCTDATGVLVQAKEQCRRSHFWVLVAPEKHVLYRYTEKHNSQAVDRLLAGYKGYLVADAHAVYDHLYAEGEVLEVGCRVGGDVAAPAPHRPGRAELPHPVPHVTVSLGDSVLMNDASSREGKPSQQVLVAPVAPSTPPRSAAEPIEPNTLDLMSIPTQPSTVTGDAVVGKVPVHHPTQPFMLLRDRPMPMHLAPPMNGP